MMQLIKINIFICKVHLCANFRTGAKGLNRITLRATSHLTISMCTKRETGKIQTNNYHHENCGPSLTGKTSSVFLMFMPRDVSECQKSLSGKCLEGYFSLNDFYAWAACNGQHSNE